MGIKEGVARLLGINIEAKEDVQLVVSVYDIKAGIHMPLNLCRNLNIAWRMCDQLKANASVDMSEFYLCVHGEINIGKLAKAFQPYLEEVWYRISDREPIGHQTMKTLAELAQTEGTVGRTRK